MKPLFIILTFIASTAFAQAQIKKLDKIPAFNTLTLDGSTFTNENVAKNKYAFFVYFNPTCPHCQNAFKTLNAKIAELPANVVIYPVSFKGEAPTQKFIERYAPELAKLKNVTFLIDNKETFGAAFTVQRFPSMYLFSPDGKLVHFEEDATKVMNFKDKVVSQK